ncbi:MAG: FAD-binding protein [Planctomycetes bacterium]|nr:FAD-binding protein [Planctomycetota bacterium]
MVLILGAGLAGLSAAHHLGGRDVLVLEREREVGGLCRSFRRNGFTFDCTGHLLHLRDPAMRDWALSLLPDGWVNLHRSAWIHGHGVLTPYPFQANTHGLPVEVRLECLLGFVEALRAHRRAPQAPVPAPRPIDPALPFLAVAPEPAPDEPSFGEWVLGTFGAGFARHFFTPYNEKLWRRPLSEVTGDWTSWSIPRPELADVLRGALTTGDKAFGYNPQFLYPREGGIDRLPRAIAAGLPSGCVRTGATLVSLHAGRRRVRLDGGEVHEAPAVLTSLPLPLLARLTEDLPPELREAAGRLTHVGVRVVNLGLRGPAVHPHVQWVYVPDPAAPFHRLGFPCALTPAMAPAGCHSIVAEIAYRADDAPSQDDSRAGTRRALRATGFVRDEADIVDEWVMDIPEAYVVFDRARRAALPALFRWYVERGVVPMGRYGAWDYLGMEDCLRHGSQAAAWVLARAGGRPVSGEARRP